MDISLAQFATEVNIIVATNKGGKRFGDNKMLISYVYDQLTTKMSYTQFKKMLVLGFRANTIELTRADLVSAMNIADVQKSEITIVAGAEVHFVTVAHENLPKYVKLANTAVMNTTVANTRPIPKSTPVPVNKVRQQGAAAKVNKGSPLDQLAMEVNVIVATNKGGKRWGDNKMLISYVYDQLTTKMSYLAFKKMLLQGRKTSKIQLARADMVAAMNIADVKKSLIADHDVHFVSIDHSDLAKYVKLANTQSTQKIKQKKITKTKKMTLPQFAKLVNDVVSTKGRAVDGSHRMFISYAHKKSGLDWSLTVFKGWLVNAVKKGLITLTSADPNSRGSEKSIQQSAMPLSPLITKEFHYIVSTKKR